MEVTFRYTDEEMRALARQVPWPQRWEPLLHAVGLFLVGVLLSSLLPALFAFWGLLLIFWAGVFLLAIVVLFNVLFGKSWIDVTQIHPITMRLGKDRWETAMQGIEYKNSFHCIQRLVTNDSHLFLFVAKLRAVPIPFSAFNSKHEALEFSAAMRRHKESSGEKQLVLHEGDVDTSPPRLSVDYSPDAAELMEYDLNQLNTARANYLSWFTAAGVLALLGVLLLVMVDSDTGRFILCVAVALANLFLLFFVHESVRRWRWRRDFDTDRLAPHHIAVYAWGVHFRTPFALGDYQWSSMVDLLENHRFLVLCGMHGVDDIVIPKRAFHSEAQLGQWREAIREGIRNASDSFRSDIPVEPTPETGNPYQPPLQET